MNIGPTANLSVPQGLPDATTPRPSNAPAPPALDAGGSQSPGPKQPTLAAVQSAAQQIQNYLANSGRTLDYRVDSATGMTVVTVMDTETGDVIRQIPNEEVLSLAQELDKRPASSANALLNVTA